MRYHWNRYGHPRRAMATRIAGRVMLAAAGIDVPALLWLAAVRDRALAFAALLIAAVVAVQRLAVRRAYGVREPAEPAPPPRTAWTAAATVNYYGDYLTIALIPASLGPGSLAPGGTPGISLESRTLQAVAGRAVITEWEVSACALSAGEAMERLYEAEPLLPERIAALGAHGRHVQRRYRLDGGRLLAPCAHPAAVPVDLLLTGERVAWLCPDCDARLPGNWH